MDFEKIGKFIAKCRKEKNLTQSELAEQLGVSDKTISNWENARCMPDLSLFKPLCEILGISINELLSGERIKKEEYQEKLEENILRTIDYTNQKVAEKNQKISMLWIVFGVLLVLASMTIFPSESSWGFWYSIFGVCISLIGVVRLAKKLSIGKRILVGISYFIVCIGLLFIIDYMSVLRIHQAPRFSLLKETRNNVIEYKTPFYQVYRINYNTPNEYYIIDQKKQYTIDTVPNVPFNRTKTGIDNLIQYQNPYMGNNSNTGNLIHQLPLAEYGLVFEMNPEKLELSIYYHMTDWYGNENQYLERSLVYNSMAIFSRIDNVQTIQYHFSGKDYQTTRKQVKENYPNFQDIKQKEVNPKKFNQYLENKMWDDEFIQNIFQKIIQ